MKPSLLGEVLHLIEAMLRPLPDWHRRFILWRCKREGHNWWRATHGHVVLDRFCARCGAE